MISENELKEVNKLTVRKKHLESIMSEFSSPYVRISVGLVELNSASPNTPKLSNYSKEFHIESSELISCLNDQVVNSIKEEINQINIKLSKYISY